MTEKLESNEVPPPRHAMTEAPQPYRSLLRPDPRSGGTAVAVSDDDLLKGAREIASSEGVFASPEGGACVPAVKTLLARGEIRSDERVVLFNTGGALKYLDVLERR